jgi:hypothetical protein
VKQSSDSTFGKPARRQRHTRAQRVQEGCSNEPRQAKVSQVFHQAAHAVGVETSARVHVATHLKNKNKSDEIDD